ncbi:uncharacterized protein MELLADRAFT_105118 [Melampsora larici-populina 98AG31]|uniref:Uncharacterized protein n=1 Tax=Melampsora larici-populina (strain 98AG31 / pathotype 3-4-7) TaxID=747676 RepID=F4RHH0_MELLP|nr:uncharacterized protein MELLADRAFT_105118 [Melampsora larici-populina 98AG31]EGG08358.1 hypothetical protein MELLADRAFT_105118 [Melampsora larici-populina 98AG31]
MPSQSWKSTASPFNQMSSVGRPQRPQQPPSNPSMFTPSHDSQRRLSDVSVQPSPGPLKRKRASSVTVIELADEDKSKSNEPHPTKDEYLRMSKKKGKYSQPACRWSFVQLLSPIWTKKMQKSKFKVSELCWNRMSTNHSSSTLENRSTKKGM